MATFNESEPNDTVQIGTPIALGDTVAGLLSSSTEWDYFKLVLASPAAFRVQLDLASPAQDFTHYLSLLDSSYQVVSSGLIGNARNIDYSTGLGAGTYYLGIHAAGVQSSAPYTLRLIGLGGDIQDFEREGNNSPQTATALRVGQRMQGQLGINDADYYALDAFAGNLSVTFSGPGLIANASFKISVLDASGIVLEQSAITGAGQFLAAAQHPGRYFIKVEKGATYYDGGTYTLAANVLSTSSGTLLPATKLVGSIAQDGEIQSYSVYLEAGRSYDFHAAGSLTGGGTLKTPTVFLLSVAGTILGSSSGTAVVDRGNYSTTDPHLAYVPSFSGWYTVAVGGSGATGSFTLEQTVASALDLAHNVLQRASPGKSNLYWAGAEGSPRIITYAFLESSTPVATPEPGFAPMSQAQRQSVREVLASYAQYVNIRFVETADSAGAQIRYGISAGDYWGAVMNGSSHPDGSKKQENVYVSTAIVNAASKTAVGQVGFETLLHETGHALGLKHPGNYDGLAGSGTGPFIPLAWDSRIHTLMSYNRLQTDLNGYYNTTPAILDIVALQALYGVAPQTAEQVRFNVSPTIPTYASTPIGKPGDIVDASNQTLGSIISLGAGTHSSIGPSDAAGSARAKDNIAIPFGSQYTVALGGAGADILLGNDLNNVLQGGGGNDTLEGGGGIDVAQFGGARGSYVVERTAVGFTVAHVGSDGTDLLVGIERLQFADARVAMDVNGNGGMAYRLYQAAFNRTPDKSGLGYQMKALDGGLPIAQVAANFIASPEFSATYGALDDTRFVTQLYQNVLHRVPDAGGLAFHVNSLANGANTRASVLVGFSESPENQAALIGFIEGGMAYE